MPEDTGESAHRGRPRRRVPTDSAVARSERVRPEHQATAPAPAGKPGSSPFVVFVRYGLPGVVTLAGVVAMAFGTDTSLEGGAGLVSAGLAIFFINWLFRIGARGDSEREAEDRARDYFDRHGRWPDGT
jgi:hypothetical protein